MKTTKSIFLNCSIVSSNLKQQSVKYTIYIYFHFRACGFQAGLLPQH